MTRTPDPVVGNILEFLAMASAVGYTLLAKYLVRRYSPWALAAIQSVVGVLFFLPFALIEPWPQIADLRIVGLILYLGLVVSLGAYGLYNYALTELNATVVAGYTNLLPVLALLFSMVLLGEQVNLLQWLAIGLVFAGVAVSQRE